MTGEYAEAVLAWAGALRAGSTQTWREFRSEEGTARVAPLPPGRQEIPTAAQLELVRRLAGAIDVPDFAGLADLVLTTPGPGRGGLDVPLSWPEPPAFGSPAVQPDELGPDELLRVCAGAVTRLLVAEPAAVERPRRGGWRPFRKQFAFLGAPSTGRILAEALTTKGLRQGGPKPTYFVLAGPLEQVMAQRWAGRVQSGSTIRWRRFWRFAKTNDRIPPAIQAPLLADRLAREVGGGRVHVVLSGSTQDATRIVAEVLGVAAPEVGEPAELLATDLLRVVNPSLTLAAGREDRTRIVRHLWPVLSGGEDAHPIGAPLEHLDWAIEAAERQADRLVSGSRAAGYAVHGDPALVVPDPHSPVHRAIRRQETLRLGLEVLGRAWVRRVERSTSATAGDMASTGTEGQR